MENKTISQFLDDEYKEYAKYVLEQRAIASVIDGCKPVQRKTLHIASKLWPGGRGKEQKIYQLGGRISASCHYHHGDKSLNDAITGMLQRYKNPLPLLEADGQAGDLRNRTAAAPRYLGTKLSPIFSHVFKDFDLLEYKWDEGEKIEPEFFLPIIPILLVNGSSGIAVGFKSHILSRHPLDVIKSVRSYLSGKRIKKIVPYQYEFNGDWKWEEDKWKAIGKFTRKNTTTVVVDEIPPMWTKEKYEEHLDKLEEKKLISSWEDESIGKDGVLKLTYIVKFTRVSLESSSNEDLINLLKLSQSESEIFVTLDESGGMKLFKNDVELLKYFVDFRLIWYKKRLDKIIEDTNRKLDILKNKIRFITLVCEGEIKINNEKKVNIEKQLSKLKFLKIDDSWDYLLRMAIYNLTLEKIKELQNELNELLKYLEQIKKRTAKDEYLSDLKILEAEIKKLF